MTVAVAGEEKGLLRIITSEYEGDGKGVLDLLCDSGITASKGEARRLIKNGGLSLNNQKVTDEKQCVSLQKFIEGKYLVVRKGKKNYHLVQIQG